MEVEPGCPVLWSNCCYLSVSYIELEYSFCISVGLKDLH